MKTSVMLGAVAGIVAITAATLTYFSASMAALLGILLIYLGALGKSGPKRIYDHFIDTIRAREFIELHLGLRVADSTTDKRLF